MPANSIRHAAFWTDCEKQALFEIDHPAVEPVFWVFLKSKTAYIDGQSCELLGSALPPCFDYMRRNQFPLLLGKGSI